MLKLTTEDKYTMQPIQSNSEVRRVPNSQPIVEHPNVAFKATTQNQVSNPNYNSVCPHLVTWMEDDILGYVCELRKEMTEMGSIEFAQTCWRAAASFNSSSASEKFEYHWLKGLSLVSPLFLLSTSSVGTTQALMQFGNSEYSEAQTLKTRQEMGKGKKKERKKKTYQEEVNWNQ